MEKTEQQRVISVLREHITNGTTEDAGGILKSPLSDFTCPDLLAQEQEQFFRKTPLMMGLSTDLPDPNSYWADNATGVPILMVRDEQGKFRAFANICRHRGAQVVPEGRGKKEQFSCPFHAWTYRNDGNLLAVNRENQFGKIEKNDHPLTELPAAEAYGTLWVRPTPGEPIDVDDCLGGLKDDLINWKLNDHHFASTQDIDARVNWKLAIDTFGENYHFSVLHRNTLANDIEGNLQTHDIYDRNYRMVFANRRFNYAMENLPNQDEWPFRHLTLSVYFIFPNTIFLVDPVGVDVLRIFPLENSPSKSRTVHSWYVEPNVREYFVDHAISFSARFDGFNEVIENEDYKVAASTQANAETGIQSEVIFGRNEPALHHYHNVHRSALGRELLPVEAA